MIRALIGRHRSKAQTHAEATIVIGYRIVNNFVLAFYYTEACESSCLEKACSVMMSCAATHNKKQNTAFRPGYRKGTPGLQELQGLEQTEQKPGAIWLICSPSISASDTQIYLYTEAQGDNETWWWRGARPGLEFHRCIHGLQQVAGWPRTVNVHNNCWDFEFKPNASVGFSVKQCDP
ncbi:hypothetical protein PoB_006971300 [Plakobranchus ocellatus]|uniref:Uncharacterized protein n=1 Tax=Plakobranchus ocellatus TaxID=259542 RepID=A0AAV4DGM9_9GAST|nr:hypothetical protein PoB_006971300 [Plakobranchus ocellatus]